MALQIAFNDQYTAAQYANVYWRFSRAEFDLDTNTLTVVVSGYVTKAASDGGKAAIPNATLTFVCTDPDFTTFFSPAAIKAANGNVKTQVYAWLKTQPMFVAAANV